MNATRRRNGVDEEPSPPQVAPPAIPSFSHDHSFTLQAIMELQKSVGEMNANLQNIKASVDGTKSKVDDLVGWKNKILGGAAVFGAVIAALAFILGKASDYVTFKQPVATQATVSAPPAAPTVQAPQAKKSPSTP